jgi:hypothetical protein
MIDHISLRRHGRRQLDTFEVTPDQLDRLERSGAELGFSFHVALFFVAVFLANITNLLLAAPPPPGLNQTIFTVITVVSLVMGVIFGIISYRGRGVRSRIFREIREQPEIGPLGDETHPVRSAELAHLPLEAAPIPPPAPPAPAQAEAVPATAAAIATPEPEKAK